MKRLKELERENARLKRIVADQAVDIDGLKEVVAGRARRGSWGWVLRRVSTLTLERRGRA